MVYWIGLNPFHFIKSPQAQEENTVACCQPRRQWHLRSLGVVNSSFSPLLSQLLFHFKHVFSLSHSPPVAIAMVMAAAAALPLHLRPSLCSKPPRNRSRGRKLDFSCRLSIDRAEESIPSPSSSANPPGDSLRIVLAAGGSGGHVYPAIAIADEIRTSDPDVRILFLGSECGIEKDVVPSAGYEFDSVPAKPLARPLISLANLLFPFRLLGAVLVSWKRLREFGPRIVVGTGGYVSAPVCLAAAIAGIDLVIQEQNSSPGMANRVLTPFAKKIFLAFNACVKYFPKEKCIVSGNPVRRSLRKFVSRAAARSHFFPRAGGKSYGDKAVEVVLVLGGSSGAHAINIAVLNMYYQMLVRHKNRYLIWQTGEDSFAEMESLVKNHQRLVLTPFLHTMDLAYVAADVVVSRSGAMTCTEILTTGKPSILIPSPNVAEDHQTKNSYIMAEIAGSKIIMEDELDSSTLETAIDEILGNERLMQEMSEKALSAARPDASQQIAQNVLSLVKAQLP